MKSVDYFLMKEQFLNNEFLFSEPFDSQSLRDLYEDDYQYIEEIFTTTLQQFEEDLKNIEGAYAAEDLLTLRKAVHKLKPAFGFVGLLEVQEFCQDYENRCMQAASVGELDPPYSALESLLMESRGWLRRELERLKSFNTRKL